MEKGKFRFLPICFRKIPNIFGIFPNTKSVSDSIPFIGQSLQPKSEYEMIPFLAKIRLLNKLIFRCRQRGKENSSLEFAKTADVIDFKIIFRWHEEIITLVSTYQRLYLDYLEFYNMAAYHDS